MISSALVSERINHMFENYSPSASYRIAENKLDNLMKIVKEKCGEAVATEIDNLNIDLMEEFLHAAYRQGIADAFQLHLYCAKNEN